MHQRIDATGRRDAARTGQGHLRTDQRHVRQQVVADDALFQLRDLVGKDGDVGHFRAGAGRGRNCDQWRAFSRDLIDTEQILQRTVVPGVGCHALGNVDGTPAAQADQSIMPSVAVNLHAIFDDGDFRVRQHTVEDFVGAATQLRQCQFYRAGFDQGDVGDDQRIVDVQACQLSGQLLDGTCASDQFVSDFERGKTHVRSLL
ncbi:hypothetical protein D9M73_187550 [compost metagenome]